MDLLSVNLINKALEGLSMRQTYLAQNIANANTPDYQAVKVSFEQALKEAAFNGSPDAITQVKPLMSMRSSSALTPELRLDLELAEASQTAMRYSALIEVLGRQMSLDRAVIQGGQ